VANFVGYQQWLNANQGAAQDQLQQQIARGQAAGSNMVGDAYKAGKSGADYSTVTQTPGYGSYGDFLKSMQTGDAASAAGAMGGNYFDAMLMQGSQGAQSQLAQAQQAYDQQQRGAQSAYASGQANAAGSTPEAQKAYADALHKSGYGWNTNTAAGKAGYGDELAAQQKQIADSNAAGKAYREQQLRQQFAKDPAHKFQMFGEGVENVLDPAGLRKQYFDPLNIPHAVGQSNKNANWDPTNPKNGWTGQDLTNNDQNFTRWLQDNGYNSDFEQG